jgi:hypothetical protein
MSPPRRIWWITNVIHESGSGRCRYQKYLLARASYYILIANMCSPVGVKGAAQMTIGHPPGLRYLTPGRSARQHLACGIGFDRTKRKTPNPAPTDSLASHYQRRR